MRRRFEDYLRGMVIFVCVQSYTRIRPPGVKRSLGKSLQNDKVSEKRFKIVRTKIIEFLFLFFMVQCVVVVNEMHSEPRASHQNINLRGSASAPVSPSLHTLMCL